MGIRVPQYDRRITQTRALPGEQLGNVSPDAFGAGLGEGIQRAASTLQSQVLGPAWDRANQAKIDDAAQRLAEKRLELTQRLQQAQGEQALAPDFAQGLEKELQATRDDIRKGLYNPAQHDAFDRESNRLALGFQDAVAGHIFQQSEVVAKQKADGRAATMASSAIQNRGDERQAWSDIEDAQNVVDAYDKGQGVPKELRDAKLAAMRSRTTADIIAAHADDGNHVAAAKWLEAYRGQLTDPQDLARAERVTKTAGIKGESQRIVDGILAKGPDVGISDALAEAAKIKDPELRDAVEGRAVQMIRLREAAIDQQQNNLYESAYKATKDDPRGIDAVPLSTLQDLKPEYRQRLEAYAARKAAGTALPWQQSKAVRYQIESMAATPEGRQKFVAQDLRALLGSMNEDDFNAISALQKEAAKGDGGTDWLNSREDVVNQALASAGVDPRPYVTKDGTTTYNEPAVRFRAEVQAELAPLLKPGQKPTNEQIQKAADAVLLKKVRLNEWGTDPEVTAFSVAKDARGKAYVPIDQIPAGKAQAIRDLIINAGGKPTDDQVQRAFAARQMNDRALLDKIIQER